MDGRVYNFKDDIFSKDVIFEPESLCIFATVLIKAK